MIHFRRLYAVIVLADAACDANCASGCDVQGTSKCDTLCDDGYVLQEPAYTCART